MSDRLSRRRPLILLAAVVLPSVALLATSVRLIGQERELAERRALQARRLAANELGQYLASQLDRLAADAVGQGRADSIVLLAAPLTDGGFALPWERNPRPVWSPRARTSVQEGERAELRGDFVLAARSFERAASLSGDSAARALATLFQARALSRAGSRDGAHALYRRLLGLGPGIRDEEGMPVALYAADALVASGVPRATLSDALAHLARSAVTLSPVALYALAEQVDGSALAQLQRRIADADGLIELRTRGDALRARSADAPARWVAYGDEPWLVRFGAADVVVIRPASLLPPRTTLHTAAVGSVEPLGGRLPGVFATLPPASMLGSEPAGSRDLLLVVIGLSLALTAVAAYLGWRDVRREVRASELRTQFVSSVSHELKTPLTSIRMYADLLRMGAAEDDERRTEYLATIANESERLSRLIANVLDFSRIEQGEQRYALAPVSLEQLARGIERTMSYPLQQAGLELRVAVEPDVPTVLADRDALAQAVLNLLSNAIKFRREDPAARQIDLLVERSNGAACIRVRDRGRGISPAARPHIFERFYRAPEAEQAGIPGTGLGLALVAHVARGHGGAVEVESTVGGGSTFSIRLPLAQP